MNVLKKFAIIIIVLLSLTIAVFASLWGLNPPDALDENSQTLARLELAEYQLGSMPIRIIDNTRSTPALGDFEGADSRTLEGRVWFPKGDSKGHPLLVFSHGYSSYHRGSSHFAKHLARNGYIVAAVNFPLSHRGSPAGIPQLLDIINQPGDVSKVIDYMLALANDADTPFYQRIDASRIGAYGLSLGGLTTALVTYHPAYKDPRISAAVMLAPPLEAFNQSFFAGSPDVSSMIFTGSLDLVVPEYANATEVQIRHPAGWFLSIRDGSHLGFANVGNPLRWMNNPDDVGCAIMDITLSKLTLPERWDAVISNQGNVLRDIVVQPPCPEIKGKALNSHKQQWLARAGLRAFFDMHLGTKQQADAARHYFNQYLVQENPELTLRLPQ